MPSRPLFVVDAFASSPFSGNPAGVVFLNDGEFPPDDLLLRVAQEVNLSETAFFRRVEGRGSNTYHLRWFTTAGEINLCGHATLATAFVAFNCLDIGETTGDVLTFHSLSGQLQVTRTTENSLELDFPAWPPKEVPREEVPRELIEGLGIQSGGPSVLYVGKTRDYMVVLPSPQDVLDVKPDFSVLAKVQNAVVIIVAAAGDGQVHSSLGASHGVFGDVAPDFVSRAFCPIEAVPEDPVCGSAHCTLIPWFASSLKKDAMLAHQLSKRGGQLSVQLVGERVKIAGKAVLFSRGFTDAV